MKLIDGESVSGKIFNEIVEDVRRIKDICGNIPGLAVVIVGNDPASQIYVKRKVKKAMDLGIHSIKHELSEKATQDEVVRLITQLNVDPHTNGILVQSPPPPQIDERQIVESISPSKDVDCFNPYNVGKMAIGDEDGFYPCTPTGIMILLRHYGIKTSGKHVVVLGRSNIVGKPIAILLSRRSSYANATVTLCHSRTQNLATVTRQADILIAAIGKPEFVTADMVKDDVVVIDVGINRLTDASSKKGYRLAGDVAFEEVSRKASFITPVPGGVGPMTIASLMYNTVKAFCLQNSVKPPKSLF